MWLGPNSNFNPGVAQPLCPHPQEELRFLGCLPGRDSLGHVHEDVLGAILRRDEAVALGA